LSLPMRNWNKPLSILCFSHAPGFEPTYEELKRPIWIASSNASNMFWAYLWGIETYDQLHHWPCKGTVLSLPMRNWNRNWLVLQSRPFVSFEPTYEELKRPIWIASSNASNMFWAYLWGIETQCTNYTFRSALMFWAYLWGIETIALNIQIREVNSVLSLPMRNWN